MEVCLAAVRPRGEAGLLEGMGHPTFPDCQHRSPLGPTHLFLLRHQT